MIKFRARVKSGWMVDLPLEAMKFPAGEAHVRLLADDEQYIPELAIWIADSGTLNDDLVGLAMYADYARQRGFDPVLFAPYFPGARQDRGNPFGAKVYADLVNAMGFKEVIILDPHSDVIVQQINNVRVLDVTYILKRSIMGRGEFMNTNWAGVIAPDAGAVKRTQRVADALRLPMFKAEKHRDFKTGKLTGFSCEDLPEEGRLLVVDDICDQGGTFLGLVEATGLDRERLALWVTHGVFSGRANQLREAFGKIYTTDSHAGARREDVDAQVFSLLPYVRFGPYRDLSDFGKES